MNRRLANRAIHYTQGVGSVLDIAPTTRSERVIATKSFNDRIHADFQRVGIALSHGMNTLNKERSLRGPRKKSLKSR